MICRKCGKEIPDDARFCKYCGTPAKENLTSEEGSGKPEKESKGMKKQKTSETGRKHRLIIWVLLVILTWTVIISIAVFLSGRKGNEEEIVVKNTVADGDTETGILISESETEKETSTEYAMETETITEAATGTNSSADTSGETESEETVYLLSRLYTTNYSEPSVTKQIEEYTYYETGIIKTETSTTYNADNLLIDKLVIDYDEYGKELINADYTCEGNISSAGERTYDENGFLTVYTYIRYDSTGEVSSISSSNYTYDENGNLLLRIGYSGTGKISSKDEYTYDENGHQVTRVNYNYGNDGEISSSEKSEYAYDENGNQIFFARYSDDEILHKEEYTYDGNNKGMSAVISYDYSSDGEILSTEKGEYIYDENGGTRQITFIIYNGDGEITDGCEYTYDGKGNILNYIYYNADGEIINGYEYTYDENGNQLIYISYSSEEEIDFRWEWTYDESGNCLTEIHYNSEGELVYREEWTYDKNGNPLSYMEYDEAVLLLEREYEYITLDEAGIDTDVEHDTDTENFINLDDCYDYVLATGGNYKIVAKERETVTGVTDYIGVLDTNYAWLVPLSENTILNPSGKIIEINEHSDFDSVCQQLQNCMVYVGDYLFIFCAESNNNYSTGYTINIESFSWTDIGNFCTNTYTLSDGYLIMMNYDDKTIMIIDSEGSVANTDIYCGSEEYIGKYSEGLFYSYNGFYNLEGNLVIDLNEYAGLVTNQPYFSDGKCILTAMNEKGTIFTGTIDTEGNFVSEFTEIVEE